MLPEQASTNASWLCNLNKLCLISDEVVLFHIRYNGVYWGSKILSRFKYLSSTLPSHPNMLTCSRSQKTETPNAKPKASSPQFKNQRKKLEQLCPSFKFGICIRTVQEGLTVVTMLNRVIWKYQDIKMRPYVA